MPKGFLYMLECYDGTIYIGSTIDLELRIMQHQNGKDANHTKNHLPVKLIFVKEFSSIQEAFNREKQIQGWSRKKKLALINQDFNSLKKYSECQNESHHKNVASTSLSHQNTKAYYSRGKLLITGEYVVLDGGLALAVPAKFGQSLIVKPINEPKLFWKSIDETGKTWFEGSFFLNKTKINAVQNNDVSNRLADILNAAKSLNPDFLNSDTGYHITTVLEFSRSWGLGSSSTLINNIANWANVNAYKLLDMTFGGSGYDIACAQNNSAITYQLNGNRRQIKSVDFNPEFSDHLFFIHLNKKQDSRKGIATYNREKRSIKTEKSAISKLTTQILNCSGLSEFESLITDHEKIISDIIKTKPVKETLFKDYKGAIKSLGAWGGDFILVTGDLEDMNYFKNKGYPAILSLKDILL